MKRYIVEYKFDTFYMQSVNSYILERKRESLVLIVQASLFFFTVLYFVLPLLPTICLTSFRMYWTLQGIYAILYVWKR